MPSSIYPLPNPKRKLVGFAGVVILHLLLLWVVQSGLARTTFHKMPLIVEAVLLTDAAPETPQTPPPAPSPPPPKAKPSPAAAVTKPTPPALVPPAEVATTPPSTPVAAPTGSSAPTLAPSTGSSQAKGTASTRTVAHVNMAQCEKPAYPSTSKRMEEEGSVHLRFLVGIDGKVIQSEIEKSSGFKRLDEAARAGLSKCQFRPAMVDGKPEQSWAAITYIWRLE